MTETQGLPVELAPIAPPSAKARKMGRKGPRWPSAKPRAGTLRTREHVDHGSWCSCGYAPRPGVTRKAHNRTHHRTRVRAVGKEVKRA